jgi:hypothetical protein
MGGYAAEMRNKKSVYSYYPGPQTEDEDEFEFEFDYDWTFAATLSRSAFKAIKPVASDWL